eukprot:Gb_19760 [translate_table: standard]
MIELPNASLEGRKKGCVPSAGYDGRHPMPHCGISPARAEEGRAEEETTGRGSRWGWGSCLNLSVGEVCIKCKRLRFPSPELHHRRLNSRHEVNPMHAWIFVAIRRFPNLIDNGSRPPRSIWKMPRMDQQQLYHYDSKRKRYAFEANAVDLALAEALEKSHGTVEVLDTRGLKQLVLSFEGHLWDNLEARMKYVDHDSEVELHKEINKLKALVGALDLHPELVHLNTISSILGLLNHENIDIAVDVVNLLQDLTKEDVLEDSDEAAQILVQNFNRLDENDPDKPTTLYNTLATIKNKIEAATLYKSRDPKSRDEEEMVENLFDCLCNLVMPLENKERCVKAEGVELMIIIMKQKKSAYRSAMRTLDFTMTKLPPACERFVGVLGLKTIFAAFMVYTECDNEKLNELPSMECIIEAMDSAKSADNISL